MSKQETFRLKSISEIAVETLKRYKGNNGEELFDSPSRLEITDPKNGNSIDFEWFIERLEEEFKEHLEEHEKWLRDEEDEPNYSEIPNNSKLETQNSKLEKIRDQLKSHLKGVEITLEVLVENDPLRPKMEGAKCTLEDCLELIDKAETEAEDGND
jgi:sugar-specific transcriptional regulator TrmB